MNITPIDRHSRGFVLVGIDGSSYAVPLEEITPCLRS